MTDGVRSSLGGLAIAAALTIVAAFLLALGGNANTIGALLLFLAGLAAVICLARLGYELARGREAVKRIR